MKGRSNLKFPSRQPCSRVDYASMTLDEQIQKVGMSLVLWSGDTRLNEMTRRKLRHIYPEVMVQLLNDCDGWNLYANRRIGVVEKVRIILEMWEKWC